MRYAQFPCMLLIFFSSFSSSFMYRINCSALSEVNPNLKSISGNNIKKPHPQEIFRKFKKYIWKRLLRGINGNPKQFGNAKCYLV